MIVNVLNIHIDKWLLLSPDKKIKKKISVEYIKGASESELLHFC